MSQWGCGKLVAWETLRCIEGGWPMLLIQLVLASQWMRRRTSSKAGHLPHVLLSQTSWSPCGKRKQVPPLRRRVRSGSGRNDKWLKGELGLRGAEALLFHVRG